MHFSPRQSQILSLMAEGFSDKEIARKIGVSYPTVRTHIDRIFREYGLRNRTEAVAVWLSRPRISGGDVRDFNDADFNDFRPRRLRFYYQGCRGILIGGG